MAIDKIFVPADLSKASSNAFFYASELAYAAGAEIVSLLVGDCSTFTDDRDLESESITDYGAATITRRFQRSGTQPWVKNRRPKTVPIRNIMARTDVKTAVLKGLRDEHVDLIVIGTKGANGIEGSFFGTLTEEIIRGTDIGVITVPEKHKYRPIAKILFATLVGVADLGALKTVLNFAAELKARLYCLYIVECHSDDEASEVERWKQQLPGADISIFIIASSDAEETITAFIDQENIDLLAMHISGQPRVKSTFEPNVIKKRVLRSNIALLSVPGPKQEAD